MDDKTALADITSPTLTSERRARAVHTGLKPSNSAEFQRAHGVRIPPVSKLDLPNTGVQSARVILKLCLYRTELGLTAPTTLADEHENLLTNEIHYVQKYAQQDWLVRRWVGGSYDIWQDYQRCIDEALVSIIPRMFIAPPAPNEDLPYQSATEHMCNHSGYLIRDLERINDLLLVARTLLVLNRTAQEYVVQSGTDLRILRLFEICLRVCARSNDNNPSENSEQICSAIVAICKSLLGTMMTLLNSMTSSNPARMLCLWVDLFMRDTTEHLGLEAELESEIFGEQSRIKIASFSDQRSPEMSKPLTLYELDRAMVALGICQRADIHGMEDIEQRKRAIRDVHSELHHGTVEEKSRGSQKHRPKDGSEKPAEMEANWPPFARGFTRPICELLKWIRSSYRTEPEPSLRRQREQAHEDAKRVLVEDLQMTVPKVGEQLEIDLRLKNAEDAGNVNNHQSRQLDQSLEPTAPQSLEDSTSVQDTGPGSTAAQPSRNEADDSDDYSDDDDLDDDERDPYGEAFRRRGIISELPLVLSPNDIMPLCVILQNAVWLEGPPEQHDTLTRLFKAIQCHILVTQETGKNLLREVLIFVAAWDLAEGDIAFTLIAEVMESVLYHGLMPIAWHNYRESKDIVSPAQSIIVKVLGLIFRQRRKGESSQISPPDNLDLDELSDDFSFDRGIIETLLEDFRSVVVPQTVALIWLQGQIRKKVCLAEDFPLNVWDMERVYEGVYQFLELFAVLTETPAWKELFVRQELSFELIAILRELENSIPKLTLKVPGLDPTFTSSSIPQDIRDASSQQALQSKSSATSGGTPGSVPVAVERPYETSPSPSVGEVLSELPPNARLSPGQDTLEEAEEPVDFPWRNLKKLVVLVLGSLAYKNPSVKTQVRELGGVELIMKCFEHDDHNPYIREHAVLCLNFLLERSPENQAVAMDAGVGGVLPPS